MYTKLKGVCQKWQQKSMMKILKQMIVELYENKKPVCEIKT